MAFQGTNEQLVKTGSTKAVVAATQYGVQELPTSDSLSSDEPPWPEDEKGRLAILKAHFKSPEMDKADGSKQLVSRGSQLQETLLVTADVTVSSEQQIEPVESKNAKEISDLQNRLLHAESEREEFRRNFQEAQEQIFSMQPRRSDITENEAAEEYCSLCANVENWIDSHFNDVLNLDYKIFAHSDVNIVSGSRLLALIELTPGAINAKDVPDTLQYYLRSAIMNFICREIFQQDLYRADTGPWELLHTIEASMRSLEPRRGKPSRSRGSLHLCMKLKTQQIEPPSAPGVAKRSLLSFPALNTRALAVSVQVN